MDKPQSVPVTITRVIEETPTIRTFEFFPEFDFIPGQFVMVWVPGVDEIPMALSSPSSISVQRVGEATSALFALDTGDQLGIRGPLGNGYSVEGTVLVVAGGIGAAPLRSIGMAGNADAFLLGARTAEELPFASELNNKTRLLCATDDGTRGYHGFVTDLLREQNVREFDSICVCGPEIMMKTVLAHLQDTGCAGKGQFSLHRYMKCGVGVCGSCCIDPSGFRVCCDGPVFSGEFLVGSEFGHYSRDASGRRVEL